ncbi:hypothetical protein NONI108955_29430 [Nocardia ninae]
MRVGTVGQVRFGSITVGERIERLTVACTVAVG